MGIVDLASDAHGGDVALKYLDLRGSEHDLDRARRRIRREADVLRQLTHPHIVPLLEVVESGDDIVLVMPYLAGGTLADRVHQHGPLPPDHLRYLAQCLLGALAAAHRAGVVHRDIKPANVLFDDLGRPYLADFGVAALTDATSGLTVAGVALGTPEYMAPEQARAEPSGAPADVFALGATLLFAATARPPYGTGDPRVVLQRAAAGRPIPVPRHLPCDLRDLLGRLLDPRPGRRPTAMEALGTGPQGTVLIERARPGRRRAMLALAGSVTVLTTAAAATTLRRSEPGQVALATPTTVAPTTVACTPQPYQPCGRPAAPFTDGARCVAQHADYDGDPGNGCEAAPDEVGDTVIDADRPLRANLVPEADTDRHTFVVPSRLTLFCDGEVDVTLTAPAGATMRLEVLRGDRVVGATTAADGAAGTVRLAQDSCFGGDAGTYVARVSWAGTARTAEAYQLRWSGHL